MQAQWPGKWRVGGIAQSGLCAGRRAWLPPARLLAAALAGLCWTGLSAPPAQAQASATAPMPGPALAWPSPFGFIRTNGLADSLAESPAGSWGVTVKKPRSKLLAKARRRPSANGAGRAAAPGAGSLPVALGVQIRSRARGMRFTLRLSTPVPFQIFTLADPYRVIIDLPAVDFRLKAAGRGAGWGLIKTYRYGQFAPGRSRIVLDALGPVIVSKAALVGAGSGTAGARLEVDLEATDEIGFLIKPPPRIEQNRRVTQILRTLRGATPDARSKPVIVIDPGHGGVDAGTVGRRSVHEKHVTLGVARRLRAMLRRKKRYHVLMTRSGDSFVSLGDRVEFSRKHGADLFISIHADAIANKRAAKHVRGATIYTLSERASDEQARQLAEKENAADVLAGVQIRRGKKGKQVKSILIDLIKRETANFSATFSNLLVKQLRRKVTMHKDARKSAAFHVLKQTRSPSVLIELGFMSNRADEKLLRSPKWQQKVASSMVRAIDRFFAKRLARKR